MNRVIASDYIRSNFEPIDRLAIVLVDRRADSVIQRIAAAEKIASPDFQAWLRHKNANGYEVYISMNALSANATGRTKADVEHIRHLYLDFDDDGTAAVERLLARRDLPKPNYLINTSPDKWQVIWKVQGFGKEQAESFSVGSAAKWALIQQPPTARASLDFRGLSTTSTPARFGSARKSTLKRHIVRKGSQTFLWSSAVNASRLQTRVIAYRTRQRSYRNRNATGHMPSEHSPAVSRKRLSPPLLRTTVGLINTTRSIMPNTQCERRPRS